MANDVNKSVCVEQTKQWLRDIVIAHNFCPFAKKELESGRVRFSLCEETQKEKILSALIDECQRLDINPEIETTLIVFSKAMEDFDLYLNIVELADELMNLQGYEGVYQLATFHPDYVFAGSDKTDAANYTNRSPYPLLHLIREESLEQVLESYPDPESIPEKNINKARELGVAYFHRVLINIQRNKLDKSQ